LETAAR
jgi:hypothetical protein